MLCNTSKPARPVDLCHESPFYGARCEGSTRCWCAGNHRVILLDDDRHSEPLVVKVLTKVVPDVTEPAAKIAFHTRCRLWGALAVRLPRCTHFPAGSRIAYAAPLSSRSLLASGSVLGRCGFMDCALIGWLW